MRVLHLYYLTVHIILVLENIIMGSNFNTGVTAGGDGSIEFFLNR